MLQAESFTLDQQMLSMHISSQTSFLFFLTTSELLDFHCTAAEKRHSKNHAQATTTEGKKQRLELWNLLTNEIPALAY
jgi:hypothetical protein